MSEETLETLRKRISDLDARLVRLLDERMEIALRVKRFKTNVVDPGREAEVLDLVERRSHGPMSSEFTRKLYREIIQESCRLQAQSFRLIGFQGEHGAYGELAVGGWDPGAVPIPCVEFVDVFDGVTTGMFDFGIVPVENSIAGAVTLVNDLLVETDLRIVGEIRLPVHHCLCVLPGTDYRDIRVVYSHPMALSQCHGFLSRNKLEARAHYDTAGAARMLADERPRAAAVIASSLCAEIYGLEVVIENVEDHPSNYTRFVVLSREPGPEGGNKCSIAFTTAHRAGALFHVLQGFAEAGINLTRIESRPAPGSPGSFAFLLDFNASDGEPRVQQLLEQVRAETGGYRFLGCYREAGPCV